MPALHPTRPSSELASDPGFLAAARARWTFAEQVSKTPMRQIHLLVARRDWVVRQTDKGVLRRYAKVYLKRLGAATVTPWLVPNHNITVFSQAPGSSPRLAAADISAEMIRRYGVPASFLLDAQTYINPFEHTAQWIYQYPDALQRLREEPLQRARQRLQLQKSFARLARDLSELQWNEYLERLQKAGATAWMLALVDQGRQDWHRLQRRMAIFSNPEDAFEDALSIEWLYQRNLRLSRSSEMRWDDTALRMLRKPSPSVEDRHAFQEATLALEDSDASTRLLLRNALVSAGAIRVQLANTEEGRRAGTPTMLDHVAYLNEQLAITQGPNEKSLSRAYHSAAQLAGMLERPLDARCYLMLSRVSATYPPTERVYFEQPTGTKIITPERLQKFSHAEWVSDRLLRETARLTVAALKTQVGRDA